jgi:hypothetical protein
MSYKVKDLEYTRVILECPTCEDQFIVYEDIIVRWVDKNGVPQRIVIPAGMYTDLASIPREFWAVIPPHRRIKIPAVIYDGLYQYRPMLLLVDGTQRRITQEEADTILYEACLKEKMCEEQAELVFLGVRAGGATLWRSHDKDFE